MDDNQSPETPEAPKTVTDIPQAAPQNPPGKMSWKKIQELGRHTGVLRVVSGKRATAATREANRNYDGGAGSAGAAAGSENPAPPVIRTQDLPIPLKPIGDRSVDVNYGNGKILRLEFARHGLMFKITMLDEKKDPNFIITAAMNFQRNELYRAPPLTAQYMLAVIGSELTDTNKKNFEKISESLLQAAAKLSYPFPQCKARVETVDSGSGRDKYEIFTFNRHNCHYHVRADDSVSEFLVTVPGDNESFRRMMTKEEALYALTVIGAELRVNDSLIYEPVLARLKKRIDSVSSTLWSYNNGDGPVLKP